MGFPGASSFTDRHGKVRWRYRRKGFTVPLPGLPGSPEFAQAYADAVAGTAPGKRQIGAERTRPGTVNALAVAFYKSAEWALLKPTTQNTYRGIIERLRADYGDLGIRGMEARHIRAMRDKRRDTPTAANNLVKVLRALLTFAVERGLRADNPAAAVKPLKVESDGFHTWTEAEIAKFEARWPVGTRERLAFDLLLYTAQRGSDVRLMGRQHVKDGRISVRQVKTGKRLEIAIHAALQASLDAATADHLTFVVTQHGEPYSPKGFGNWFSEACDRADVPHCSAHGLRKAAARRMAEAGNSASRIAAVTGHATLKEVERYTRAADQVGLADAAIASIGGTHGEQDLANRSDGLAKTAPKSQKA